ncbi:MAG: hypothetical protein HOI95_17150 [Chromatiales bacterium]|jgi:protein Xni|nr:hypothetical protein [Chromatiales bacterium]
MNILLVDGLNLIRRIYAGVPAPEQSDHIDRAVDAVGRSLARLLSAVPASHAIGLFDGFGPTWRHHLYPAYKATRPPMPEPLAQNMSRMEAAFATAGAHPHRVANYEADDVIASVAVKASQRGAQVVIVSTDKSMLTLLGPRVRVRNHFDDKFVDDTDVHNRFGVSAKDLELFLALVGDSGQGIPGVPGIGAKTAARLVNEYPTLSALLDAADSISGRTGKALAKGRQEAELSLTLTRLDRGVDVGLNLRECRISPT